MCQFLFLKSDGMRPVYSKLLLNKTTIKLMCDGAPSIIHSKLGQNVPIFIFKVGRYASHLLKIGQNVPIFNLKLDGLRPFTQN